jgi:hypothetical protein
VFGLRPAEQADVRVGLGFCKGRFAGVQQRIIRMSGFITRLQGNGE